MKLLKIVLSTLLLTASWSGCYAHELDSIFPATYYISSLKDTFVLYRPAQEVKLAKEFKLLEEKTTYLSEKYLTTKRFSDSITLKLLELKNTNDLLRIKGMELNDKLIAQRGDIEKLDLAFHKTRRRNKWLTWSTIALSIVSLTLLLK